MTWRAATWLGMAGAQAFVALASVYAVAGIVTFPGSLPAARVVGVLAQGSFALVGFSLVFLVLLFPTGMLPSRHWRAVAAAGRQLYRIPGRKREAMGSGPPDAAGPHGRDRVTSRAWHAAVSAT